MFYIIKLIRGNEEFNDKLIAKDVNDVNIIKTINNLLLKFKENKEETILEMGY